MLLYSLFHLRAGELLALSGIPFAVCGAFLAHCCGTQFQHLGAIGFISLFGVSSMDGILLMSYIRRNLHSESAPRRRSSRSATRMRQILMNWPVGVHRPRSGGFSTSIGAQVQQPLACVIVAACCSRRLQPAGDPDAGAESSCPMPGTSPGHETQRQYRSLRKRATRAGLSVACLNQAQNCARSRSR